MKKNVFGLPVMLLLTAFLFSCDKGSDTPSKSRTELLTQQSWKFNAATANGLDVAPLVDECYKDNILTFSTSGTGTVDESVIICSPSTAGNFTWSFQNGENELQVSATFFPGGSGNFDIISISETTMVLAQDMTFASTTANVRVTLVH